MEFVGRCPCRAQRFFKKASFTADNTHKISMILAHVFMDAFIEIVIAVSGHIVDQLENTDSLVRGRWLIFPEMQHLHMRVKYALNIQDRVKGALVTYKWILDGKDNPVDTVKLESGRDYQDRDIGCFNDGSLGRTEEGFQVFTGSLTTHDDQVCMSDLD